MRYLFMAFGLLLSFLSTAQEDIGYKKYSYSELFQMIEDEEDTLFVLRDAIIEFNLKTDLRHSIYAETSGVPDLWEPIDSIHINKALEFYNVQFIVNEGDSINGKAVFTKSGFHRVNFQKQVTFENTFSVLFNDCTFQSEAYFTTSWMNNTGKSLADSLFKNTNDIRDRLIHGWFLHTNSEIAVQNSVLKKGILIRSGVNGVSINLKGNEIEAISNMLYGKQPTVLNINGGAMELVDNHFTDIVSIDSDSSYSHTFQNNHFRENVSLRIYNNRSLYFGENRFEGYVLMNIDRVEELKTNWQQFYKKTIPYLYFREDGKFFTNMTGPIDIMPLIYGNDNIENFIDSTRISSPQVFLSEQERYSELYEHFKKTHNTQSANLIYLEIKDLETERLVYEYTQNPSFDLYFTIKINQFLKLFSDYGTRPSKAITFSIYVILAFALIYLFFPNHWDSHGKNRIMDRYRFFLKYVNKDSGIHEVYLDEKKPALLA
ncbi:MAG: hypothetical protein HWE07_10180, partial [Cytophagia bacterium]|nr:hypothetical protein [Cytophagia bacterium]